MNKITIFLFLAIIILAFGSDASARASSLSSGIILDDNENAIYIEDFRWGRFTKRSAEVKAPYKIYKIDLENNSISSFYEGDNKSLSWLSMSPDGQYIAVIKNWEQKNADLLIIDKKLKIGVFSIPMPDGIVEYVWSPDSKKIAYISGAIGERSVVKSTGVWVYDIDKKEKKKIVERSSDIGWVKSGEIYVINYNYKKGKSGMPINEVYESAVYRYDAGLVPGEEVRGNDFSLDGRYSVGPKYWRFSAMSDEDRAKINYNVYDLQTGTVIPEDRLSNVFANPETIIWGYFYWVKGNRLVFENNKKNVGLVTQIGDVENNKILKTVNGELVGFSSDRSKLVIYSDQKFLVVDVP